MSPSEDRRDTSSDHPRHRADELSREFHIARRHFRGAVRARPIHVGIEIQNGYPIDPHRQPGFIRRQRVDDMALHVAQQAGKRANQRPMHIQPMPAEPRSRPMPS